MQRPPVRYALICLAITFVWMIIEHLAGWNTMRHDIGQYSRMMPFILFTVMIFVSVNQSRGIRTTYPFNEALRDGMIMAFIFCAGFTLLNVIYLKFINPEFFETLRAYNIHEMTRQNKTKEEIEAYKKSIDMSLNGSSVTFFLNFFYFFFWGVIVSAVAGLVYRIKKM